jgi:hypothetical protein
MNNSELKHRISNLSLEHKDLDDAIKLMLEQPFIDELQIQRLKKKKLKIKDELHLLESKLIPDLEA